MRRTEERLSPTNQVSITGKKKKDMDQNTKPVSERPGKRAGRKNDDARWGGIIIPNPRKKDKGDQRTLGGVRSQAQKPNFGSR